MSRPPPGTDVATVSVVIADDSYVMREFLAAALSTADGIELQAVCVNGSELEAAVETWTPDVVVTDIRMPPTGTDEGLQIAGRLRDEHPDMGVVVLSQYAEPAYALALFDGGSARRAYLLKERIRNLDELLEAIHRVADGGSVVDPAVVDVLIEARSRSAQSKLAELTPRERELLAQLATGKSNGAIAESLFLTKRAVEKHVNSIFSKLNLPEDEDVSRRVKATLIYLAETEPD